MKKPTFFHLMSVRLVRHTPKKIVNPHEFWGKIIIVIKKNIQEDKHYSFHNLWHVWKKTVAEKGGNCEDYTATPQYVFVCWHTIIMMTNTVKQWGTQQIQHSLRTLFSDVCLIPMRTSAAQYITRAMNLMYTKKVMEI